MVDEIYHDGYTAKTYGNWRGNRGDSRRKRKAAKRPNRRATLSFCSAEARGVTAAEARRVRQNRTRSKSLESCGAEVAERQRARRKKTATPFQKQRRLSQLIKRCNDFGAGGVSVAIGELADGLDIDLNAVPKKYEGLDGTELAISESQERMAVVVAKEDAEKFLALARTENLAGRLRPYAAAKVQSLALRCAGTANTIVDISAANFLIPTARKSIFP